MSPSRIVEQGDGIAWLRDARLGPEHAIVTSVPDLSEMQPLTLPQWRALAIEITELACRKVAPRSLAVFYQTDIKVDGHHIDKAYLAAHGAERAGVHCLWHKIVCRTTPGFITCGRPAFGHWLAYSRELTVAVESSTADVLPELGVMTWARAMPMSAAVATCRFIRDHTDCRVVVDPFCGHGTILAVANDLGLDAIGVDLSPKRVRKSQRLVVHDGVITEHDGTRRPPAR